MANPRLILAAVLGNVLVIAGCFAIYGWNTEGAGAATRSTARFAICFFLAGFAAPGLRRWIAGYPEAAGLIHAFVAAQMVHFCAVIALHTKFAAEPPHVGAPEIAAVLTGFSIVLGTGVTAAPSAQSKIVRRGHLALLYIVWLILVVDYAEHPTPEFRLVAAVVVIALGLRHLPRRENRATGAILGG